MAESDLIKLYSQKILGLAADIPHMGHLETPSGTARKRAPLCGSVVSVDLVLKDGHVSEFAQDVKACALGQAAASVLGRHVIGMDRAGVQRGRDELYALLTQDGPPPAAPFEELELLSAAKEFTNRHASILLAFDATLAAWDAAENAACA
ncbi:MAG: iron-sulfur cluster assembly scaffold protein [Mangrovicoccus sp.]|nr:iron-sulfur cluster assembly scaffold protein [Mangrovicoccus sp.]